MRIPGVSWAWELIRTGKIKFLLAEAWMRFYKFFQEWLFFLRFRVFGTLPGPREQAIRLETKNPVAFESPDHLIPWGTSRDNSTNKKFVRVMRKRIEGEFPGAMFGALDLGCSGGQLVADFRSLGWLAVGLEGSDFSLKHGRANWPALAGKNLFTCDVAKPFKITANGQPAKFHLITMWEVLEHIATPDLPQLFDNIVGHLETGGYFVASTTSAPDIHDGVDLHQTKWTNGQWRQWLSETHPELETVNLNLNYYQFVRHNEERSFLTYRKVRQATRPNRPDKLID
jgi:2-polyprenyl-3-methyl-5-hydroxy-6-metoxy-1,4-benzoquinol methylase